MSPNRRLLPLLCLAALLAGCRTTLVRETPEHVHLTDTVQLDPAPLADALRRQAGLTIQTVSGAWRDHAFAAEIVMKGDGTNFTAVCLAPQMRLATVTITPPHTLRYERAPQIPRAFQPEYILVDLAFINLETDALRHALAPAFTVSDDGTTRRISTGETLLAELVRAENGRMTFRNDARGYTYDIAPRTRP